MVTFTRAAWLFLPVAITLSVGCEGSGGSSGTTGSSHPTAAEQEQREKAAASAAVSAAATRAARGTASRSGLAGLIVATAREVGVMDAQQRELDKVEQALGPGPKDEVKALQAEVAAAVRAGALDPAKLAPRIDAVEQALGARKDKEAAALVAIGTALAPSQRGPVVTAVRVRLAARADHAPERGKVEVDAVKRRVERLSRELDLDAAQQKKVEALVTAEKPVVDEAARDERQKRVVAVLDAMEAGTLDAKTADLGPVGKGARAALDKHLAFVASLLPLLDAKQREHLAASIERGRGVPLVEAVPGYGGSFEAVSVEPPPPPPASASAAAKDAKAPSAPTGAPSAKAP